MAHYALLDEDNIVTQVIVGVDENETVDGLDPEAYYSKLFNQKCLRTSYNENIRKNFASPGMRYDEKLDAFLTESPFPSWSLNIETGKWEAPTPRPDWGMPSYWDEEEKKWKLEAYRKNTVTIEHRVLTCYECPFFDLLNTSCTKCGCSAAHLHTNPSAVCPEGKW